MESQALKDIEQYKRNTLKMLLMQCSSGQQRLFHRMYPDGPDGMPEEKIPWAIQQCENTIKKNEKRAENGTANGTIEEG